MSKAATLGNYLHAYFEDFLPCQKGLRLSSIRSYRDSIKIFLQYIAKERASKVVRLQLSDLKSQQVLNFLQYLETTRGNKIATRNQRLAALRSFFEYLAENAPEMLGEAQRVAGIPIKRASPPKTLYLEKDEIESLFNNLPVKGRHALRDQCLLLFLYNTGARVQEVSDLRIKNLDLESKPRVHLHGKGDKWRVCPLWPTTEHLLVELTKNNCGPNAPVFISQSGTALTRYGIYKIVKKYVSACKSINNSGLVSPHTFRHTSAVHLLEAGVDINVIRSWLGHVSLETTNRYAEISLQMKAAALEFTDPTSSSMEHRQQLKWRSDETLINWLESL